MSLPPPITPPGRVLQELRERGYAVLDVLDAVAAAIGMQLDFTKKRRMAKRSATPRPRRIQPARAR